MEQNTANGVTGSGVWGELCAVSSLWDSEIIFDIFSISNIWTDAETLISEGETENFLSVNGYR